MALLHPSTSTLHHRPLNAAVRALQLCRWLVRSSVQPLLHNSVLTIFLSFLLSSFFLCKFMASPLFLPLRAFLFHRLLIALRFVLLTTSLAFLGFFFHTISSRRESAEANDPRLQRKRKKLLKGKKLDKEENTTSASWLFDSSSSTYAPETSDVIGLISTWLFEPDADHESAAEISSSCDEIEEEDMFNCEEDDQQGLAVLAKQHRHPCQAEAVFQKARWISDIQTPQTQEVHDQMQMIRRGSTKVHSKRSRSYSAGLNFHDQLQSSSANAASTVHDEPTEYSNRRKASLSCDFGSSTESPWLNDIEMNNLHADLHSPPLPPLESAEGFTENASAESRESLRRAFKESLAPWRYERAAGGINMCSATNYDRSGDELQQQSEAFLARRQEHWKLQGRY